MLYFAHALIDIYGKVLEFYKAMYIKSLHL